MLSTIAYLKMFKLNISPEVSKKFDREKFLTTFGEEFNERLTLTIQACKKMGVEFTYSKFTNLINEQHTKFNAISNKKLGGVLNEELFKAFYAVHVIPNRMKLFPEEHLKLTQEFEKRKAKEDKEKQEREQLEQLSEASERNQAELKKKKALELVTKDPHILTTLSKKGIKVIEGNETVPEALKNKPKPPKKSKGL